jgi:hypothetical protein
MLESMGGREQIGMREQFLSGTIYTVCMYNASFIVFHRMNSQKIKIYCTVMWMTKNLVYQAANISVNFTKIAMAPMGN